MAELFDQQLLEKLFQEFEIPWNSPLRLDVLLHKGLFDLTHGPNILLEMAIADRASSAETPAKGAENIVNGYALFSAASEGGRVLIIRELTNDGWRQLSPVEVQRYLSLRLISERIVQLERQRQALLASWPNLSRMSGKDATATTIPTSTTEQAHSGLDEGYVDDVFEEE